MESRISGSSQIRNGRRCAGKNPGDGHDITTVREEAGLTEPEKDAEKVFDDVFERFDREQAARASGESEEDDPVYPSSG